VVRRAGAPREARPEVADETTATGSAVGGSSASRTLRPVAPSERAPGSPQGTGSPSAPSPAGSPPVSSPHVSSSPAASSRAVRSPRGSIRPTSSSPSSPAASPPLIPNRSSDDSPVGWQDHDDSN